MISLSHIAKQIISKIQGKKSITADVPILPISSFPTHLHCCINRIRTVLKKQVLRPTNKCDFQNRDHYFPELLDPTGRQRQRPDNCHLIFILPRSGEENSTFIYIVNKLLYILVLQVLFKFLERTLLVDYDFSPL